MKKFIFSLLIVAYAVVPVFADVQHQSLWDGNVSIKESEEMQKEWCKYNLNNNIDLRQCEKFIK